MRCLSSGHKSLRVALEEMPEKMAEDDTRSLFKSGGAGAKGSLFSDVVSFTKYVLEDAEVDLVPETDGTFIVLSFVLADETGSAAPLFCFLLAIMFFEFLEFKGPIFSQGMLNIFGKSIKFGITTGFASCSANKASGLDQHIAFLLSMYSNSMIAKASLSPLNGMMATKNN